MFEEFSAGRRCANERRLPRAVAFVLASCAIAVASAAGAITLPPGFTDEQVTPLGATARAGVGVRGFGETGQRLMEVPEAGEALRARREDRGSGRRPQRDDLTEIC